MGKNLIQLRNEMAHHTDAMRKLNQIVSLRYTIPYHQVCLNLTETSTIEWRLRGPVCDEDKLMPVLEQAKDRYALLQLNFAKTMLLYFGNCYTDADMQIQITEQYLDTGIASFVVDSLYFFYRALIALALYPLSEQDQKSKILDDVESWHAKIKISATHAPMNNLHRWYLVEAEKCGVMSRISDAEEAYDQAIQISHKNEYLNDEALANELAGKFYLKRGRVRIAQVYLTEASYLYELWGENACVTRLAFEYENLLNRKKISKPGLSGISTSQSFHTSSGSDTQVNYSSQLDIFTLLKSSQAISEEILLDSLLAKVMRTMLENAGAQKGVLLLGNPKWQIQAMAETVSNNMTASRGVSLDSEDALHMLPRSIVQYVIHTSQNLVLDQTYQDQRFMNDSYVIKNTLKSVLCEPILHQGKLLGVLYLENNLTPGAFTADRLEVLKILSSQAAISIENAQLYANLEERYNRGHFNYRSLTRNWISSIVSFNKPKSSLFRRKKWLVWALLWQV
ncbi:hypothetical protein CCP4SC76_1710009 [Gammaproteobacteria bacterium]